ncbi:MAG: VWA domain-containing protein, partial [Deltaproteobacteria bacterium]|nr:VWA domain-containing protein [Deltaproteobacteria bacterium]
FATAYQYQHPDHVVVNVMTVDSNPNNCDTDFNNLAGLAAAAFNLNGVRTFVVALEGLTPLTGATQVAAAGGTPGAVDLTAQGALPQLTSVLNQIRDGAIPCEYDIPPDPEGPLVPAEVNLAYTPGGSGTPQDVLQVSGEGACGTHPGWYYDSPTSPTKIMLCPTTCNTIKQDLSPLVEVLFGCPTLQR